MIERNPDLGTGVPLLDEQRKTIFQWLTELESAAVDERTLFGVYAITRLKHYVREHFAAEEDLMKSAGYPHLVEHIAEHDVFRAKLSELHLKSIGQDISVDTVASLKDWLSRHIAQMDMAYVPYLNNVDCLETKKDVLSAFD